MLQNEFYLVETHDTKQNLLLKKDVIPFTTMGQIFNFNWGNPIALWRAPDNKEKVWNWNFTSLLNCSVFSSLNRATERDCHVHQFNERWETYRTWLDSQILRVSLLPPSSLRFLRFHFVLKWSLWGHFLGNTTKPYVSDLSLNWCTWQSLYVALFQEEKTEEWCKLMKFQDF